MKIRDEIVQLLCPKGPGRVDQDLLGVRVHTARAPSAPVPILFQPVLHLPFQGQKRLVVGTSEIIYGPGDLVVLAAHLPALVEVTRASSEEPYVALEIALDRQLLSALVAELPPQPPTDIGPVSLARLPEDVLEPILRLLRLSSEPTAATVLAPNVKREIFYRLLTSASGDVLRGLLRAESVLARVEAVTEWMLTHLDAPVRVEELATRANMSVGSFHRQFREVTGTSPVNYFKTVRLHEARRQIIAEVGTLSQIASAVGFCSPSQFSRDYKRTFGVTPSRDAAQFRTSADALSAWRHYAAPRSPASDGRSA